MTCIVGYVDKENNRVVVGADSASIAGLNITIRKDEKIFRNGEFLIGCTSSFRMIQILRYSFVPPSIGKEIYEYMCTDFIKAVRECFQQNGFHKKETDGEEKGGRFLVGYKDRLFQVDYDFQVGETLNGMDAVGCGDSYALGALYASSKTLPAEERIELALLAASHFSAGVAAPFHVLTT